MFHYVVHDPLNRLTNIMWSLNDEPIEGIFEIGSDKSLNIASVRKQHSGTYRCTAETDHDTASATVPVKVIVNGPVIVSNSGDQDLFSGSTISLFCKANGIPAPEITWTFNGTDTKKTGEDLVIANADKWKDSGVYMCVASNQVGTSSKTMLTSGKIVVFTCVWLQIK